MIMILRLMNIQGLSRREDNKTGKITLREKMERRGVMRRMGVRKVRVMRRRKLKLSLRVKKSIRS